MFAQPAQLAVAALDAELGLIFLALRDGVLPRGCQRLPVLVMNVREIIADFLRRLHGFKPKQYVQAAVAKALVSRQIALPSTHPPGEQRLSQTIFAILQLARRVLELACAFQYPFFQIRRELFELLCFSVQISEDADFSA